MLNPLPVIIILVKKAFLIINKLVKVLITSFYPIEHFLC